MKIFKAACVIVVLGFIGLVALSIAAEHDMRVWCTNEGGQYINKGCYTVINIPLNNRGTLNESAGNIR